MKLISCHACGMHHYQSEDQCPHCSVNRKIRRKIGAPSAMALLLGLTLSGCGDKDTDTAEPEPSAEPEDMALYGVPALDEDGDGYIAEEEDCDDTNPDIHPGAEETPGDGVDSNCNGEDDT